MKFNFFLLNFVSAYFAIQPTLATTTTQRTRKPKKCPAGFSTGIDQLGREDLSNTRKCHMKSDTADVVACNDDYGIAEMKIKVNKEFYDAKSGSSQTPIGFEVVGNDYIQVRVSPRVDLFMSFYLKLF